jgi:alpha-beta hydrolase superfamily lysophospholipase
MPQRITFRTADDVEIVGDWVTASTTLGAVILLHTMQTTRQSWIGFQQALASRGLASLAIDLRGHGESTRGPDDRVLDAQKFKEGEQASSIQDVIGAFAWVRGHGIERARIAVAGASIGANLALRFLSDEPLVPAAALLSPGEDYHGVTTFDVAEYVLPHQGVWMGASAGDDDESFRAVEMLENLITSESKVVEKFRGYGHGFKLFESDPALMDRVADWLRERILAVS